MLTIGLIALSSFLAQADAPLTEDYTRLEGKLVDIVYPADTPLPPGWPESRSRSGLLERATPRPRNLGGYSLTITWDEPWAPSAAETLNSTVRDAKGQLQKLVVTEESDRDRLTRIKAGWIERGFEQIGPDPLDPLGWISKDAVEAAKRAQQMALDSSASTPAPETASVAEQAPAPPAQERKPAGFLTRRGPQLLISLVALALAGAVVKTLVL